MNDQKQSIPIWAVWLAAAGLGTTGITGVVSTNQLSGINQSAREEVRAAEVRGRILSEIATTQKEIIRLQIVLDKTMPRDGVLKLHNSQQSLIDKLIAAFDLVATKEELRLLEKRIDDIRDAHSGKKKK